MHTIIWSRFDDLDTPTLYDILRLRSEVFVVEQACAFLDLDGRDQASDTEHAWINVDGRVVAYLRVLTLDDAAVKISRVVTASAERSSGFGRSLMIAAIERFAGREVVLDAQSRLEQWYETLGFVRSGERFVEDDILHTPMRFAN